MECPPHLEDFQACRAGSWVMPEKYDKPMALLGCGSFSFFEIREGTLRLRATSYRMKRLQEAMVEVHPALREVTCVH